MVILSVNNSGGYVRPLHSADIMKCQCVLNRKDRQVNNHKQKLFDSPADQKR